MAAAEGGSAQCVALLIDESDFDARVLDPRDTWARRAKESAWRWGRKAAAEAIDAFGRVVAERAELALAIGAAEYPELHAEEPAPARRPARL